MDITLENVRGESLRILGRALIQIADVQDEELAARRETRALSRDLGGLISGGIMPVANGGVVPASGDVQSQAAGTPVFTPTDEADLAPASPEDWSDVVEPPGIPEQPAPEPAPVPVAVTLEQVRAKLASLSQAGKAAVVKTLLKKFGAAKLTEVDAGKFAELLAEAEAL